MKIFIWKAIAIVCLHALVYPSYYAYAETELPPQLVVLQYHHVDTSTPAITSVSPEVFEKHMAYLNEHYQVIALQDGLNAIENGGSLPLNAIAITFDDGYKNILENAHPILKRYDFPYTIFINPGIIGKQSGQLNWQEVKAMQDLAVFANHTLDHLHLLERAENESEKQWLKRVMANIEEAQQQLEQKLGGAPKWLAYPFGEYNSALKEALESAGYIGFGQQSGVVSVSSDFQALPRFPAAGNYAKLDTLKVKMASLAMPVTKETPEKSQQVLGNTLETFAFTIDDQHQDVSMQQMACYFKGERIVPQLKSSTFTVKLSHTFKPGRIRINCTAPSKSLNGRFYWYSKAFFTPTATGTFLD